MVTLHFSTSSNNFTFVLHFVRYFYNSDSQVLNNKTTDLLFLPKASRLISSKGLKVYLFQYKPANFNSEDWNLLAFPAANISGVSGIVFHFQKVSNTCPVVVLNNFNYISFNNLFLFAFFQNNLKIFLNFSFLFAD